MASVFEFTLALFLKHNLDLDYLNLLLTYLLGKILMYKLGVQYTKMFAFF